MKRKNFLKSISASAFFAGFTMPSFATEQVMDRLGPPPGTFVDGSMFEYNDHPIPKVRVGIIGMGNRGSVLLQMFNWLVKKDKAVIVALSDLQEEKVHKSGEYLSTFQTEPVELYHGSSGEWMKLCDRDDIDLVVICTPWDLHTPMSVYAMEQGKHVASEVPIATTLNDCWKLIDVSERTRRHCMMMENCTYNGEELWILNMIQEGVFGELTHAEGSYIHDLRWLLLDEHYYEDQWRLKQQIHREGNFYTTHGLGPISAYFDIGRGDTYDTLVSMTSKQASLASAAQKRGLNLNITGGDMNTTLIKTKQGRTIMLQHDVYTGRPYSRINTICGTKAVHQGYPSRLYIDPDELSAWGHRWLDADEYKICREKYDHPIWARLQEQIKENEVGHGGMDFVMIYRLIDNLNNGKFLDISLYDSILWSAVTPLSEISVLGGSTPISVPDFTGGSWSRKTDSPFMRIF